MNFLKILLIALFLFSCSENIVEQNFERKDAEQEIKILLKYGFKDEINTFEKTLTKDLVQNGLAKMNFWFQPNEQLQIMEKLEEINFWSLPEDTLKQNSDSVKIVMCPDPGLQSLRVNYNNLDKTVNWFLINDYPEEFERINILTNTILEIVNNDPEYQNLPPVKGGYF
jgi:hypothetical protein